MKKKVLAWLLAAMMMLGTAALADGGVWHNSRSFGSIQFANYTGWSDGYQSVDGFGGITAADPYNLTVISKSASIWSEPSTGSKKLGSVSYGDSLLGVSSDGGYNVTMDHNFYQVEYKGKKGWVGSTYVVRNTLEIVLMESNVPAYIAPDVRSKKDGSLSKMTRYRVIGFYDDFYIVSFRGAACAYIPKDAAHYDTTFMAMYRQTTAHKGSIEYDTKLRTGPDDSYPEIKTMNAGTTVEWIDVIDGWCMIHYSGKGADGDIFAFVDSNAVSQSGGSHIEG